MFIYPMWEEYTWFISFTELNNILCFIVYALAILSNA